MSLNQEDDSDEELPSLPFLLNEISPRKKLDKSVDVLLNENLDLTAKIQETENKKKIFSEKIKTIENMNIENEENVPGEIGDLSVASDTSENLSCKHFCELNFLQLISRDDLALQKCGYDRFSAELLPFEKIMVSMEPIHLETILSSIFSDKLSFAIKDIRSFITYLLRIIATSSEKQCINACVIILKSVLQDHLSIEDFSFDFVKYFCPLLFNYGVDISKCPFVEVRSQIERNSRCEQKHVNSRMPEAFEYNLSSLLKVLELCIRFLKFQSKDFKYMFLSLIWLRIDDTVCNEAIFESFEDCIVSILCQIEEISSGHALLVEIAEAIISVQCYSDKNKWKFLCKMTKVIPYAVREGRYLRRLISFNALRAMTQNITASEERGVKEFSLTELQSTMRFLCEMEPDNIIVAVTFIDLCLKKMKFASEGEFESLCQALKECSASFSKKALPATLTYQEWARFHLELIYSRVKIMSNFSQMSATLKKEPEGFDDESKQTLPECAMECEPVIKNESALFLAECAKGSTSTDFSIHLPDLNVFVPQNENTFTSIFNDAQNEFSVPLTVTRIKTEYPENVSDASNLAALSSECSDMASNISVVVKNEISTPSGTMENQQLGLYINENASEDLGVVISDTYSASITEYSSLTEGTSLGSPAEDVLLRSDASLCGLKIVESRSVDDGVKTSSVARIESKCASKITDFFASDKEKKSESSFAEPECNLNFTHKNCSDEHANGFNTEFHSEILKAVEAICSDVEKQESIEDGTSKLMCEFTEGLESLHEKSITKNIDLQEMAQSIVSNVSCDLPKLDYSESLEVSGHELGNSPVSSVRSESSVEHSVKFESHDLTAENKSCVTLKETIISPMIPKGGLFQMHLRGNISPVSQLNDEYDEDNIPIEEIKYDNCKKEDEVIRRLDASELYSNVRIKSSEKSSELSLFDNYNAQPKIEKIKPISEELSSNDLDDLVVLDTPSQPSTSNNKRKLTSNESSSKKLKKAETLVATNPFAQDSLDNTDLVICDSSSDSDIDVVWSCVKKNSEDCIITEVKNHVIEIVID